VKDKTKVGHGSLKKSKVIDSGSPRSKWYTMDMIMTNKHGDKIRHRLLRIRRRLLRKRRQKPVNVVKDKADVVNDKVDVGKAPVVKDNSVFVVVKEPAEVVKDKAPVMDKDKTQVGVVLVVKDKSAIDVVSDKMCVDVVSEKVQDDVVKDNTLDVVNDKASVVAKNKPTDVKEKSAGNVVKEKVPTVVKGKKFVVVKDKAPSDILMDKSKANLPKDKPKPKQKVILIVQALSEVLVLRSSKQKVKPEDKPKATIHVLRSKETPVKRKRIYQKEDMSKKKVKVKLLKGKTKKEDYDSELDIDEVDSSFDEVDRKPKKLKIKSGLKRNRNGSDSNYSKYESDEESVPKKHKKKEKVLTLEEAAHKAYLLNFLTLRARTVPSSLFLPSVSQELIWLSLDIGDKIEVTYSKIHEILCVPVGGYSLLSLEQRPVDH
ncbi:hypothetical protein Tco_1268357, partial [Tanacetum coccineum]